MPSSIGFVTIIALAVGLLWYILYTKEKTKQNKCFFIKNI